MQTQKTFTKNFIQMYMEMDNIPFDLSVWNYAKKMMLALKNGNITSEEYNILAKDLRTHCEEYGVETSMEFNGVKISLYDEEPSRDEELKNATQVKDNYCEAVVAPRFEEVASGENFPAWAFPYITSGDTSDLDANWIQEADEWRKRFPKGSIFEINPDSDNYRVPAFGVIVNKYKTFCFDYKVMAPVNK